MLIQLTTKNTNYGIPRRLYLLLHLNGSIDQIWQENFNGLDCVPKKFHKHYCGVSLTISIKEFNLRKKSIKSHD